MFGATHTCHIRLGDTRAASHPRESGHTLLELLLTLLVMAIAAGVTAGSLVHTIPRVEAAVAARLWEGGASAAQLNAIWGGSPVDLVASGGGLAVSGPAATLGYVPPLGDPAVPVANVSRWMRSNAVGVRFLPVFGSPDGAGSLYFGVQGSGQRVTLRLESGLTKRTSW